MTRIMVTLEKDEREALLMLARVERRDPRAQAAWLIRRGLEQMEMLPGGEDGIRANEGWQNGHTTALES